jgi:hypothetical protein
MEQKVGFSPSPVWPLQLDILGKGGKDEEVLQLVSILLPIKQVYSVF